LLGVFGVYWFTLGRKADQTAELEELVAEKDDEDVSLQCSELLPISFALYALFLVMTCGWPLNRGTAQCIDRMLSLLTSSTSSHA
jgi:hypothetical protein